jgi:hypothetical protein
MEKKKTHNMLSLMLDPRYLKLVENKLFFMAEEYDR